MIKKLCLKKVAVALAAVVLIGTMNISASASNDNYGFEFTLKANSKSSYSGKRYRQTKKTDNKWKVDFTYSAEGAGTKAIFWLAKNNLDRTIVSKQVTIKQGSGPKLNDAETGASRTDVRLGTKNNNNVSNTYKVSGYWDEETN